jgi:ATP-dependent RNA helicase RhlE
MTGVRRPASNPNGQPDPMRTSIDSMGAGARRGGGGGGGGNRNRGGGGGGGGGGYGARNNTARKYGS